MRIAQIAPIIESVPPKSYGGTERVISALTEELVKRGHDVTLFASGDSETKAKLFSVYHTSLRKANIEDVYGPNIWSLLNVGMAYQMQDEFDIIHDHNSQNNPVSLPLANLSRTPVVMTLHGPLTNGYSKSFDFYRKPHLVTISKRQAEPAPLLNYIGNVYHGLNMSYYPFSDSNDGYLLFVGRVHVAHGIEEKGLHHAIDIAEKVGLPLIIAAKLDASIAKDVEYFKERIKPRLRDKIRWLGEVNETQRNQLMSRAIALLHPINFPEPFGLTLIEAMACGCPVIAFDKGSIPEVIQHGKTGYVVNDTTEAVQKVKHVATISRQYCRSYSLQNFSAARMARDYEHIYNKAIVDRIALRTVTKRFNGHVSTDQIRSFRRVVTKNKSS
jgi:glycosyltransferase involved in cell wall biosynthesis